MALPTLHQSAARRRKTNAAAGGGFDPTSVTGLKLWLKADAGVYHDAGSTLATDGQDVQQWNDQSGNGNNATQSTPGSRPTYHTNLYNGQPAVTFGSGLWLAFTELSVADFSIFIVQKVSADSVFLGHTSLNMQVRRTSDPLLGVYAGGAAFPFSSAVTNNILSIFEFVRASGTVSFYETAASRGTGSISDTLTTNEFSGISSGGAVPIIGDVSELLIYDNAIASSDRAAVESYLTTKYAL